MSDQPRYEFQGLIATGGMGEVWRATDTMLGRDVAIKLLKPEYADDPVNRSRFDSEARHAAALHHRHVAAVYDVGEMPTASGMMRPYLVMELVDGKPLSDLLKDGRPLDPDVVRDLVGQGADAIAAAHRAGIVHRDIKPANMLVTPDGDVKVTDFGIARAASSGAITGTGQVMGTPQYLSPEQARGERATSASDVYSLGVVTFECLTGHRPFQKETAVATAIAHLHDPVPPLPDTVPADLAAVVEKALSKDPADRYPDAAAFHDALRGTGGTPTDAAATTVLAAGAGAAAAGEATSVLPAATAVTPAVEEPGEDEPGEDDGGGRKKWLRILLIVLAVLLIGVLIWFFGFRDSSSEEPEPEPSAPTSAEPSPTKRPTQTEEPEPETIDLDPSDYRGRPVDDVMAELRGLGLSPSAEVLNNDGSQRGDTVQDVNPTQGLTPGDLVTVSYWGSAPEPEPEPDPTTEPEPDPTTEPEPDPTTSEPPATPDQPEPSETEDTATPDGGDTASRPAGELTDPEESVQ